MATHLPLRRPILLRTCISLQVPQTISPPQPASAPSASQPSSHPTPSLTQTRNANFIKQPRRPYQFTQLVALSDGSTFLCRTTSPQPYYRSQKDKMNNILWQPSNRRLRNIEVDEAGKLAAFRERFGRGWDLQRPKDEDYDDDGEAAAAAAAAEEEEVKKEGVEEEFTMADLLKDYADKSGLDFKAVKTRAKAKKKNK